MRRGTALLCLGLCFFLVSGCGEEAEVRITTRVFPDGGMQRSLRLDARDPERKEAYPADWLAEGPGLVLADPEAWDSVETGATFVHADGNFSPGEAVPPLLGHRGPQGDRPDRGHVTVKREDLVVLDHFLYEETLGDPYGGSELASTVDALLNQVAVRLRRELQRQFGPDVVTAPVESYVTTQARAALVDFLTALRETEPPGKRDRRAQRLQEVRATYRLPQASADPEQAFWDGVQELTDRAAAEVARANPRLDAAEIADFVDGAVSAIVEEPGLQPEVDALQTALVGAYGLGMRTRFVARVTLPGRLLRTTGTPDGDAVVFVFDQDDLSSADTVLRVESAEPNGEALTRLGARRDLEADDLLRLTALLTRPDLAESLRAALARAVEAASLKPLREDMAGDALKQAAAEVADLLDPSRPWPPR
jgi:hypothetical protein